MFVKLLQARHKCLQISRCLNGLSHQDRSAIVVPIWPQVQRYQKQWIIPRHQLLTNRFLVLFFLWMVGSDTKSKGGGLLKEMRKSQRNHNCVHDRYHSSDVKIRTLNRRMLAHPPANWAMEAIKRIRLQMREVNSVWQHQVSLFPHNLNYGVSHTKHNMENCDFKHPRVKQKLWLLREIIQ